MDDFEAEYGYNSDGLRISKTVDHYAIANGARDIKYYYAGGRLIAETWGNKSIEYLYDSEGIYCIIYTNGTTESTYYFVKNLQGDVMAMYDQNMICVAEYAYDAWGNILYVKDGNGNIVTDLDHIGNLNPIRYRSYYYDYESGFYYLQSRYYDSLVGRFINADSYVSTGQGFLGFNMFVYCNNNPVIGADYTGTDVVILLYPNQASYMGHVGLLIQDSDGSWWYLYWGAAHKNLDTLEGRAVQSVIIFDRLGYLHNSTCDFNDAKDLKELLKLYDPFCMQEDKSYSEGLEKSVHIKGDFSGAFHYIMLAVDRRERISKNGFVGYKSYSNYSYQLYSYNCLHFVVLALAKDTYDMPELYHTLLTYKDGAHIPRIAFKKIQAVILNM